ncbi:MAG: methylmalonyl Co-A mutase-associated GTPase MeaB, partial [Acidaminococcaceae bacterium]
LFQTGKIEKIRANRIKSEVTAMINDHISRYVDTKIIATEEFANTIGRLQTREIDPYSVVDKIVDSVLK